MKTLTKFFLGACVLASVSCAQVQEEQLVSTYGTPYHWEKGTIVVDTPERPEGQQSVLGLTAPKMEVVRVGFVGLGMRGPVP